MVFINPGYDNSFFDLVNAKDTRVFVDKTDFLEKTNALINTDGKLLTMTRPRRFGKTISAQMLSAYYSKGCAGKNIFNNLKITKKPSYDEHLNKYDVIYVDMNTIDGLFDSYAETTEKLPGVNDLVDFLEYSIIQELKSTNEFAQ